MDIGQRFKLLPYRRQAQCSLLFHRGYGLSMGSWMSLGDTPLCRRRRYHPDPRVGAALPSKRARYTAR